MWGEVSSRIDILTKCQRKSVRVDYFGRMYVSLPNTQEKNSNCLVDRQMLENGTIAAIICQQPKIQGSKPLSLLFAYLTTGETPEKEYNYTAVDIRIKENL